MESGVHIVQIYEKKIEAALTARDNCKIDAWGYNYWTGVAAALLRKLNIIINEDLKGDENGRHGLN